MSELEEDPIDTLARELARLDVDADRAQIIRTRAHAELDRGVRRARPGWRRSLRHAYRRAELPLLGLAAAAYLFLAFDTALLMYR